MRNLISVSEATKNGTSIQFNHNFAVHSNYRSSRNTSDEPEEDGSEQTLTPELDTTILTPLVHEGNPVQLDKVILEQQHEEKGDRVPTSPAQDPYGN